MRWTAVCCLGYAPPEPGLYPDLPLYACSGVWRAAIGLSGSAWWMASANPVHPQSSISGESRYKKKRRAIIKFEEFEDLMKMIDIISFKSLVALLYYTGLRIAEIVGDRERKWKKLTNYGMSLSRNGNLPKDWIKTDKEEGLWDWEYRDTLPGITKEDMILEGNTLWIYSKPLKHGKREGEGQLELEISYPYVDLIIKQWENTEPGHKVWDFSTWKAWRFISKTSKGKLYPHAFRMSRATRLARNPEMSIADMMQWFGWARASTADSYIEPIRSVSKVKNSILEEIPE